jgi:hypothetical protein
MIPFWKNKVYPVTISLYTTLLWTETGRCMAVERRGTVPGGREDGSG